MLVPMQRCTGHTPGTRYLYERLHMALTCFTCAALHWTYPRDKARAMELAREEPSVHPEVRHPLNASYPLEGCTDFLCSCMSSEGLCNILAW